jgi:hypothetical protein
MWPDADINYTQQQMTKNICRCTLASICSSLIQGLKKTMIIGILTFYGEYKYTEGGEKS